jgi:alpha-N-arabinofuranosidase
MRRSTHLAAHVLTNRAKNTANYLALNQARRYIATVVRPSASSGPTNEQRHVISFDEWNVWYHSNKADRAILDGNEGWPHAPRLLEDIYNFEDVLQVGCILNTFIRRSDVVKIACIAQLVNVIAPIMTDPKGAAWRQTIYYPYYFASIFGRGTRSISLSIPRLRCRSGRQRAIRRRFGRSQRGGGTLTFFAVNRHGTETLQLDVALEGFGPASVIDHQVMTHTNLEAVNTAGKQDEVSPRKDRAPRLMATGCRRHCRPIRTRWSGSRFRCSHPAAEA